MSFWNGANGSRHKSRSIAPRDLMFRLTRESKLATGRVRPTGGPDWRYEPPSLILRPTRPLLQIAESLTGRIVNRMNWEMLAAIGQLAAVCVGIPSLIYLAV